MNIPYASVDFTKNGTAADEQQVRDAITMLRDQEATNVLILAHGWNNDISAAERLYRQLGDRLATLVPAADPTPLAIVGVRWPSIRWADDDQIAGGGVAIEEPAQVLEAAIRGAVDDEDTIPALLDSASRLDTPEGRSSFVEQLRTLAPSDVSASDEDAYPQDLIDGDVEALFLAVQDAVTAADDGVQPVGSSGDAGPGVAPDLLDTAGTTSGVGLFGVEWGELARNLLNTFTYYTMKARASDVGARGVAPMVDRINAELPGIKVHLAGHSFGARVVAAAASSATSPISSLTLLQGAFSHHGFTEDYAGTGKDGAFLDAISSGRIRGPIAVTHTHNDRAVHIAYAIASRLARQSGAAIGDASDLYGGIGSNGSVGSGAIDMTLLGPQAHYDFTAGKIHNLKADDFVANHGDVTNAAVANALAQALGLGED